LVITAERSPDRRGHLPWLDHGAGESRPTSAIGRRERVPNGPACAGRPDRGDLRPCRCRVPGASLDEQTEVSQW